MRDAGALRRLVLRMGVWAYVLVGIPYAAGPFVQHACMALGASSRVGYVLGFAVATAGAVVVARWVARLVSPSGPARTASR